jgi:hypothetical protein
MQIWRLHEMKIFRRSHEYVKWRLVWSFFSAHTPSPSARGRKLPPQAYHNISRVVNSLLYTSPANPFPSRQPLRSRVAHLPPCHRFTAKHLQKALLQTPHKSLPAPKFAGTPKSHGLRLQRLQRSSRVTNCHLSPVS